MPTYNIIYQTQATATGGRDGRVRTPRDSLNLRLSLPKELGGNGFGNNPEELFAAGYAACFLSAMKNVASTGNRPRVPDSTQVTATVGIGSLDECRFGLSITLSINMPGFRRAAAEALVMDAHEVCPYSNAVRGNIEVVFEIN